MNRVTNFSQSMLPIAIAALFITFELVIQLPTEIYIRNTAEFTIPLESLTYTLFIAFIGFFILFFLPTLIPVTAFRDRYFSFLATLAFLMWFTAQFVFGNYGTFDGRGLTIEPFSPQAIAQVGIWIALLILSIIFSPKIKKIKLQAISGLLLVLIIFTAYEVLHYQWTKVAEPENITFDNGFFTEDFLTFSTNGNIIHIVLDEQQYTILAMLMEQGPNFVDELDGFIFFPNAAANYPNTMMAIPTLLTGSILFANSQ